MATQVKDLQILELKDTIAEQRQLISTLRVALDNSNAQTAELTVQIKLLNEQLHLFNEAESEMNVEVKEPEENILVTSHARKPKTKLEEKFIGSSP